MDAILRYVYLNQLEEVQATLASWGERTVEFFVAAQEMEALTEDFGVAVKRVRRELEEKRKDKKKQKEREKNETKEKVDDQRFKEFKGGDAAKMWAKFRQMHIR